MWSWCPGKDGKGYLFEPCGYGFRCVINVPEDTEEAGFIVRTGCSDPGGTSWGEATKDFADDRFAILTGRVTEIYLKTGDGMQYTSLDGGKTLSEIRVFKMAGMIADDKISYSIAPAARITSLDDIAVYQGDEKLEILSLSSLGNKVGTGTVTMAQPLDITKEYRLEIAGYGEKTVIPTTIFDSPDFIENFTYDGDDLGAAAGDGVTVFKVWAPTASRVVLNLFEAGNDCDAFARVDMERVDRGVWQIEYPCESGTYYTYTVTTGVGTQEAVDPYARAAGVNGERGMVIDLNTTDPEGFDADAMYSGIMRYDEAVIWEVHVRDFSIAMNGTQYPGKYLAFTETGLTNGSGVPVGMDYLQLLGITHVHLQPVYDYATVDESRCEDFNWGYDPKNYNVPEGNYSTDPFHGEVRINEFKQMVQAIHSSGMGVIMDVVYNHTYDANANLNRIVPYYYYRYNASGDNSNGSGCGNETASDRVMFRKFMIDSVTYWAKEYHIDGFRFDLMALHDIDTMQMIEQALHAINPCCIIYGEGWTGGTSALNTNKQTTQANISKIKPSEGAIGGISVFNDAIRDGLKGSVFDTKETGYISGSVTRMNAFKVLHGMTGGVKNTYVSWKAADAGVINYMSCHDNLTLFDKLTLSCPGATEADIAAMYRLGAACVFLGRGTPFMLAGEEMMRTKQGDSNSYKSSDEINHIDWESLVPGGAAYEMSAYYQQLIALRKAHPYLTCGDIKGEVLTNYALAITWSVEGEPVAYAVINPNRAIMNNTLPEGNFTYVYGGEGEVSGSVPVPGMTWVLLEVNR
ncbi:MAG: type I pullulanase [Clostridiales bacterium]|nr:type I pullulanase [Clostridiales bacterium]